MRGDCGGLFRPGLPGGIERDGLVTIAGSDTLGYDPRHDGDVHYACPIGLGGRSKYPDSSPLLWVVEMWGAYEWTAEGCPLSDYEPHPSAALVEGVMVIRREDRALNSERTEDAKKLAEAQAAAQRSSSGRR